MREDALAFLYHAVDAGLDMGIAPVLEVYEQIDKELLEYVEDVLLTGDGSADRLRGTVQGC